MDHVTSQFGGRFSIEMGKPWKKSITDWQKAGGKVTHLTAYGIPLPQIADQIREFHGDMLIVVGAEKVPSELFHLADWNVAVTNQPISEVSALGIFLDWIMEHKWLVRDFSNATLKIVPTEHGKKVLRC
jgi:tRNA (cytidine56-2'-O)-methyltransferase